MVRYEIERQGPTLAQRGELMRPQWMIAGLGIVLFAVGLNAQDASPLKSPKDKTSYALGVAVGKSF